MTKCDVMYYCKSAGVLLNLEADEGFLLRTLAFSRGFQCNGLVFHAEMGFLLFFLRKGFPGIPKREVRMPSWVGRCKIEWPVKLTVRSFLYDKTLRSLPLRYRYFLFYCSKAYSP